MNDNTDEDSKVMFDNVVLTIILLFLFGVPQRTVTRVIPCQFSENYLGQEFSVRKIKGDLVLLQEERKSPFISLNGRWFYKKDLPSQICRKDIVFKMIPNKTEHTFLSWEK